MTDDDEISAAMRAFDIDEASAVELLSKQAHYNRASDALVSGFPESFSGSIIDRGDDGKGRLVVRASGEIDAIEQKLQALLGTKPFIVVEVAMSLRTLVKISDAIGALRENIGVNKFGVVHNFGWLIDIETNSVQVLVADSTGLELRQNLRQATVRATSESVSATEHLQVFDQRSADLPSDLASLDQVVENACTGRITCDRPMRGGIRMVSPRSNSTFGYTARNAAGGTYVLSHGHDLRDNPRDRITHNGRYVGYVLDVVDSGRVDASRIGLDSYWTHTGIMYRNNGDMSFDVVDWQRSQYGLSVGTIICMSGVTTGNACGPVRDVDTSPRSGTNNTNITLWERSQCSDDGDSGAPVYDNLGGGDGRAVGLHISSNPGDCNMAFASPIAPVLNAMNVQLELN